MGVYCCVKNCNNKPHNGKKVSYHNFPKDEDLRMKWLKAVRCSELIIKVNVRVCSEHFLPSDYFQFATNKLRKNTIPSVFSWNKNRSTDLPQEKKEIVHMNSSLKLKPKAKMLEERIYVRDYADYTAIEDHWYPEVIIKEIPEYLDFSDSYSDEGDTETMTVSSENDNCFVFTNNERLYKCDVCNKTFNRNYNLKRHIQTHVVGKKRFLYNNLFLHHQYNPFNQIN